MQNLLIYLDRHNYINVAQEKSIPGAFMTYLKLWQKYYYGGIPDREKSLTSYKK